MERLTTRDETGEVKLRPYCGSIYDAYERLAAYEDTGLAPEEIEVMAEYLSPYTVEDLEKINRMLRAEATDAAGKEAQT